MEMSLNIFADTILLAVQKLGSWEHWLCRLFVQTNNAKQNQVGACRLWGWEFGKVIYKTSISLYILSKKSCTFRLQKMFSRKWEYIFMQAEAQSKVDKKRDKQERKILDTQERAFWDVYRPPPGCVNTTDLDIKKVCKIQNSPFQNTDNPRWDEISIFLLPFTTEQNLEKQESIFQKWRFFHQSISPKSVCNPELFWSNSCPYFLFISKLQSSRVQSIFISFLSSKSEKKTFLMMEN